MIFHDNRRDFLKTSALAGVGYWVAGSARAEDSKSPNGRIRFACIGIGGQGVNDSGNANSYGDVVALVDIDDKFLATSSLKFPNAKKYVDFRKMLDECGKDIDAVTVSTPDHTHAVAAAMAMRMGKACFCQKPLTHSVYEARKLGEIAREMKVATQMGNQGTSDNGLRKGAAMVRAGALGNVKEVHVWTDRPVWNQGGDRPKEDPVPANLHWEEWLGPAPYRPYAKGAYHRFAWRGWWDFGSGALGDMACHTVNLPFAALDLRDPTSIEAESAGHNKDSYPKWSVIRFEFPANATRGPVSLFWYDGGKRPSTELTYKINLVKGSGCLIVGDKGKLYSPGHYGETYQMLDGAEEKTVEFEESPGGYFAEFVRAIRGDKAATSNFADYSAPLTETILLGNLAVWAGKKIQWDSKSLKATNAPEVDIIIKPEYRSGYSI